MNRVYFFFFRDIDDLVNVQVGFERFVISSDLVGFIRFIAMLRVAVFVGIDCNRFQPEFKTGAENSDCNFSAVGYENLFYFNFLFSDKA